MLHLFCYIFGFGLGSLCERERITKYYNNEINRLYFSNKKYKSYILHKHLLEDWKKYDKECENNFEEFNIDE
jgi:hypothetical protein